MSRLKVQAAIVAVLLIVALGVALFLSSWLQSIVSDGMLQSLTPSA